MSDWKPIHEELAQVIAAAIRGGPAEDDNGVNYVGAGMHTDGKVRIDADIDLRVVAAAVIEHFGWDETIGIYLTPEQRLAFQHEKNRLMSATLHRLNAPAPE